MNILFGSRRTSVVIAWLFLLVFCCAIGYGWWSLATASLQSGTAKVVAAIFVFAITLLAAFFARQIGQMRAAAKLEGREWRWYYGWRPWLFLAVVSALGTLNAAFVLLESRAILRDDIQNVRDAESTLRTIAKAELTPAGYNERRTEVIGLLTALRKEIVNLDTDGRHCGVGREATDIIMRLKRILPEYRIISGSGPINPCDPVRAERMYRPYEEMAMSLLPADRQFQRSNGPAKIEFLGTLDQHFTAIDKPLRDLENAASGFGSSVGIDKTALIDARNNYNADLKQYLSLRRAEGQPDLRIKPITYLQSDQVDSYAATVRLFWDRLGNFKTYIYLLLALLLDYVVIFMITHLNERFGGRRDGRRKDGVSDHASWFGQYARDPKFIWVNPPWAGKET